jgi:hypothetical protein
MPIAIPSQYLPCVLAEMVAFAGHPSARHSPPVLHTELDRARRVELGSLESKGCAMRSELTDQERDRLTTWYQAIGFIGWAMVVAFGVLSLARFA